MLKRFYGISAVLVVGLVDLQIARAQSDGNAFVNPGTASTCTLPSYQAAPPQIAGSFPPPTSRPETAGQPPTSLPQPWSQCQWSPNTFRTDTRFAMAPQYAAFDASQSAPVPPPAVTPLPSTQPFVGSVPPAAPAADGTWRDDGRYVIININGKEMKLLKASSEPPLSGERSLAAFDNQLLLNAQSKQPAVPADNGVYLLPLPGPETIGGGPVVGTAPSTAVYSPEGTVHGRLLQKGYPVANCYVVIAPWPKGDKADSSLDTRVPLSTTTNDEGFYCFEHVPAGEYKLTWLPAGAKQWIRRIAMRPDVVVLEHQDVALKDIRMALQTIN